MKRLINITFLCALTVILVCSCSMSSKPFEKGKLESGNYINTQADLVFLTPDGWDIWVGEDAQEQVVGAANEVTEGKADTSNSAAFDLAAMDPQSGSNINLSYTQLGKFSNIDLEIAKMIESVEAEAESYGWEIEKQDEYDHEIADKDFIVVEIKISVDGISINEYICIRKIDDYACMIVIVASPFGSEYNDFESIAGCFTSVDE